MQRAFYPEGDTCHVYLLHPPGGVVGGDRLDIDVTVASGHALITTPGATKFYRSAGASAQMGQSLLVGTGASLEWLPQENIFFPGAKALVRTRIQLSREARLAAWEIHCFGRPANGERFEAGHLSLGLEPWRDDEPLLMERLGVHAANLDYRSGLAGHPVSATLVMSGCDSEALAATRSELDRQAAATLIDDLLLVRALGDSTERARAGLTRVWTRLRPTVLKKSAHLPRIWAT